MRPLWPADPRRCVPIYIGTTGTGGQGLIGGMPPKGVAPRYGGLRYFLTVPLFDSPKTWASIFVADFNTLAELSGQLHPLGAVDVVLHPPAERGTDEALRSDLTPRALRVEPEETDDEPDEEGVVTPRGGHKLGGRPCIVAPLDLADESQQLFKAGFSHVLQVSFPDRRDDLTISGNWPFGETELHLFAKPPFWPHLWRWCRQR